MKKIKQLITAKEMQYLVVLNAFSIYLLLLFDQVNIVPLNWVYFILLFIISVFIAYIRPQWCFLMFIGLLPVEIVNLAPASLGFNLRAYQFIGIVLLFALVLRFFTKNDLPKFPKLCKLDYLVLAFLFFNLVATFFSSNFALSMKLFAVLASFVYLYFLTRYFSQNLVNIKRMIPMFVSSLAVIICYGFIQNILYLKGVDTGEVMPGRPNATFAEADWLGMYLVFAISILYSLNFYIFSSLRQKKSPQPFRFMANNTLLIFTISLLIITVSRSAWLGFFAVSFFFLWVVLTRFKARLIHWKWGKFSMHFLLVFVCILFSFLLVNIFSATNFELYNRAQSTSSGLQEITISCEQEVTLKNEMEKGVEVFSLEDLDRIGCRHINLEEMQAEKDAGRFVTRVNRKDPNFEIRKQIYTTSFEQLSEHPIMGIGMGSITEILGKDERGAGLNASNIFLEIWLGSGIFGLAIFSLILVLVCFRAFFKWLEGKNAIHKAYSLFIFLGLIAIIIPNLFNAGIFLGFFWVFLALTNYKQVEKQK